MQNCPGSDDPNLIDLDRFFLVDRTTQDLIRAWFRRAEPPLSPGNQDAEDRWLEQEQRFEGFIYAWIAFNGWAMTVCDVDGDEASVNLVGSSPDLQHRFLALLDRDPEFRGAAERFQALWPIFSDKDIRRSRVLDEIPRGTSRPERIPIYLAFQYRDERGREHQIGCRPRCAGDHGMGAKIPLDWAHSLSAIYQVRCNLFHGYKGIRVRDDTDIVAAAYNVLHATMRGVLGFE